MERSDRPTHQNAQVVAVLESVRALESVLDAMAANVDALERHLDKAEERLEEIAKICEQD
jgi:DNA anti-recombination protein RmuC